MLNTRDHVVGYRISYSVLSGGFPVMPTADEAGAIVDDVLSVIDKDERVLGNMAHMPVTREMLPRGVLSGDVLRRRAQSASARRRSSRTASCRISCSASVNCSIC